MHVQQVWDADAPWRLQLLPQPVCCLCEAQHRDRLIDVIARYCIQLGPCLPSNQLLQTCILQLHQFFAFKACRASCQWLPPLAAGAVVRIE